MDRILQERNEISGRNIYKILQNWKIINCEKRTLVYWEIITYTF